MPTIIYSNVSTKYCYLQLTSQKSIQKCIHWCTIHTWMYTTRQHIDSEISTTRKHINWKIFRVQNICIN